ncbi:FERM, ARHGEF and pleckstrin domain-containing protein 2-like isoform X2 [Paramacrobiotus metropolitanus]|uniref:FERM, ARHGEF and pleckstrin domain-containing protein 2-like isoform X2 n=1 Tax=Paramacrobiotus metropolitanus TaxID=2943436 RepID=UPI002445D814|nr:FERM, ARHGEF and pleckstrin domain-containing protein 2-like isoform X2 [Paramacrobiotus metropolitanus]
MSATVAVPPVGPSNGIQRGGGDGHSSLSRQASGAHMPSSHGSGKSLNCRVEFLDDSHIIFKNSPKARGSELFTQVCEHLALLENDYFGLEYTDSTGNKYWLDLERPIGRQLGLAVSSSNTINLHFCVKFYTPDPVQLEEEITRYLFVLQIRKDLANGLMPCQDTTAALLAAYVVQAEEGDYSPDNYRDYTYLLKYRFLPQQDVMFLSQVRDSHLQLVGQSPAEADLNFLETARRCEMYGMRLHAANDHEGVALNLAVAHMGIVVFQNLAKINTFSWAKIRKLSFKRKRFLIKLHPEGFGYYKDTVEFYFDSRNSCKNFWKKCIEHHGFFRCPMVASLPRSKTRIFPSGSSFRFSGRTQKQVLEFARDNYGKRPSFQRASGASRIRSSQSCGASLAATPLLPMARTRDSRYNTTGGTRSRKMQQGENGVLARSRSEPMEVTEATNPDKSSDSGSRTLERTQRVDSAHEVPLSSREHLPDDYTSHTTIMRTERYDDYRPNGHVQEVAVTMEDVIRNIPSRTPRSTLERKSEISLSARLLNGTTPAPSAGHELEELARKINGWKLQSAAAASANQESFLASFESKSFGESLRTLADDSMDGRKRRHPSDLGYFIAKEILNGERTYKKDLEVLCVHLKNELSRSEEIPSGLLHNVFSLLQPIWESQGTLLVDIEHRLSSWDNRVGSAASSHRSDCNHIGDLLLRQNQALDQYCAFLLKVPDFLQEFDVALKKNKAFEQLYRRVEGEKYCYLPLTAFLLKPAQRLLSYQNALERLLNHYPAYHSDVGDCEAALQNLRRASSTVHDAVRHAEHYTKLAELQRDLMGIDNLAVPGREFVREGCLQKLSKKGYQQRMFILLTDLLLYANRTANPVAPFKIHGQIGIRGMMVEDCEAKMGMEHCFTIYGGNRALVIAANSSEEKLCWLHDLHTAIEQSKRLAYDKLIHYGSLKSYSSSDEILDKLESTPLSPAAHAGVDGKASVERSTLSSRTNTTLHVCWHRNMTIGVRDLSRAFQLQMSGYLLRKFKSSDGWQKLWVVFTNFSMFFFKNNLEECPLASLPLIGYRVSPPSSEDQIHKDHVFKLHFRNHVYFFRTESEYSYSRWMEIIGSATETELLSDSPDNNGLGMHV